MLIEFRDKLMETKDDKTIDKDKLWDEFRDKVETTISQLAVPIWRWMSALWKSREPNQAVW